MSDFDFFGEQYKGDPKGWSESIAANECPMCGGELEDISDEIEEERTKVLFCTYCGEEFYTEG